MRASWSLPLFLLPLGCTVPAHLVSTADDSTVTVEQAADALCQADVIALGEIHQTPPVHALHKELVEALFRRRRGDLVIAMEMFDRDVQSVLLRYVSGDADEYQLRTEAKPWPDYVRDYRPLVQFARENGIVVLGANAPADLAARVRKEGLAAVQGAPFLPRSVSVPEDDGYEAFRQMMAGHPGVSPETMHRYYEAQCVRDDSMAEVVVDWLQEKRAAGRRPLVVLVCGHGHSDHRRGAVARMVGRMPTLDVRVLSAEESDEVGLGRGFYSSPKTVGDYVVVVPRHEPSRAVKEAPREPVAAEATPAAKPAASSPAGVANEAGVRPALGLMPDYAAEGGGVRVDSVRAGGAAEKAGIEVGDVITMMSGVPVRDVQHYTELLDLQTIGRSVTVRVRRAGAEVDLQVVVGMRTAH
ncbi:MAG: ChaN family lipoprotein [Planctomycetota bacterium]